MFEGPAPFGWAVMPALRAPDSSAVRSGESSDSACGGQVPGKLQHRRLIFPCGGVQLGHLILSSRHACGSPLAARPARRCLPGFRPPGRSVRLAAVIQQPQRGLGAKDDPAVERLMRCQRRYRITAIRSLAQKNRSGDPSTWPLPRAQVALNCCLTTPVRQWARLTRDNGVDLG
jgi:hypothetical protein